MVAVFRKVVHWHSSKMEMKAVCQYYFVCSLDYEMLCNLKEEVMVFKTLEKAHEYGSNFPVLEKGFKVVGLGPNKWELFKRTETYTIVEDE